MPVLLLKSLKVVIILTLLSSFLIVLAGIAFVTFYPTTAVQFVERFLPEKEVVRTEIRGIGILGDSQADEYRGDDNRGLTYASTTINWVEQLQKYRNLNFGPWGSWGEPRRVGYAYNWARTGATVNSVFVNGQLTGLMEQVRKGDVNVVIIQIGANDYAPILTPDGYDALYNGKLSAIEILRKRNTIVGDITTAVDTIRGAKDIPIILVLIPDWGNHLGVRVAFPLPEPRSRVAEVIEDTNEQLKKMADERGIVTVNPNELYNDIFNKSLTEITVGDQQFSAVMPGDDPHSLFLEDGTHSGTVMNGLFANYMILHLNKALGTTIQPFSDQELLEHAGL